MGNRNALKIEPLDATLGAVVTGVKLSEIYESTFRELYDTWLEYALLVFPDQHLSGEEQMVFAKRFGDLEIDLLPISNVRRDGSVRADEPTDDIIKVLRGNMGWHMDSTYMPVQAKGAVFTAHTVPDEGGGTAWADMRAAHDALDDETRVKVGQMLAHHSLYYSQAKVSHTPSDDSAYRGYGFHDQDPPLRPLVKVHPETGRPALVIGRHAFDVPGMDAAESAQFLADLADSACQAPRVYEHTWTPGEAVVWDNRCLLHRGLPWDMAKPRVMYHSRIAGGHTTESCLPAP